ncbi:hypothetical protein [Sunxiuqinia indica]|uniref:hypothetical protein n=1 Tax=Sunxiuqinia indica TaxID=2692584 RepID=UPI00135CB259|nr:hypothetical protein [Sunxiuqinia indica]
MKQTILVALILMFSFQLKAQKNELQEEIYENRLDSLIEDVVFGDDELSYLFGYKDNMQFLYMRSSYDSRTFYAGREIGESLYNMTGQLYYLNSNGIFAGLAGAWYDQIDPAYQMTVISLGYSKGMKKAKFFRYRASFDYYLYHNSDPDFDPTYSSGLNLGTTFKTKTIGTRLNASFLLGDDIGSHLSADVYAYLTLLKLNRFNKLRLEPELTFYFGSESVAMAEYDNLGNLFADPLLSASYTDKFGMMNTQLEIPLSLTYKGFDFEVSWTHNFPRSLDPNLLYPENSFVSFSVGYIFNL